MSHLHGSGRWRNRDRHRLVYYGSRGSHFCRLRLRNCRDSDSRRRGNERGRREEARRVDRAVRRLPSGGSVHLPYHRGIGGINDRSAKFFGSQNWYRGARWCHRYTDALGSLIGHEWRARAGASPSDETNSQKYTNEQNISQADKTTQRHELYSSTKK
jgi:hypothetical protein